MCTFVIYCTKQERPDQAQGRKGRTPGEEIQETSCWERSQQLHQKARGNWSHWGSFSHWREPAVCGETGSHHSTQHRPTVLCHSLYSRCRAKTSYHFLLTQLGLQVSHPQWSRLCYRRWNQKSDWCPLLTYWHNCGHATSLSDACLDWKCVGPGKMSMFTLQESQDTDVEIYKRMVLSGWVRNQRWNVGEYNRSINNDVQKILW